MSPQITPEMAGLADEIDRHARLLREHVDKGDLIMVEAAASMLHQRASDLYRLTAEILTTEPTKEP